MTPGFPNRWAGCFIWACVDRGADVDSAVALARELISAFSASLAAGRSPQQVADDFRQGEARRDYRSASQRPRPVGGDLPQPIVQWIERVAARPASLPPPRMKPRRNWRTISRRAWRQESRSTHCASNSVTWTKRRICCGRRDWPGRHVAEPVGALLDEVLRRARLWASERQDVARN